MTVPRVAITTLGCKTNQFESAAMNEALDRGGFIIVPFDDEADFYIINTCTVTARTDAESRRLIRRAVRRNPAARVVVTGCYAQVSPEEVEKVPGVHLVLGNTEKRDISRLLRDMGDEPQTVVADIAQEGTAEGLHLETFSEHTRAFLQIQNGCNAFCSYCIVPYARGRSRSVPVADVLAGIERFTSRGFQEVVLTGIHLSAYGGDLTPPVSLNQLLQAVDQERLTSRLRLGSLEPAEISDDLIHLIATSEIICPHFHIPLQSGDDQVLQRMNRSYTGAFFEELAARIVAAIPDACIGADVIAGFPGESEEEFRNTLALLERSPVSYLHVFPFSARPGTPAADMPGHVPPSLITDRARLLRLLSDAKKRAYLRSFVGKDVEVLVQSAKKPGLLHGLSRHYLTVRFPGGEMLHNRKIMVRVTEAADSFLLGQLLES